MEDKELQEKLLKMLLKFEMKMDWVGQTHIRQQVSERIVEIRMLLKTTPEEYALLAKVMEISSRRSVI